jgi:hypothetical protein
MKKLITKAEVILFTILYFFIGPSFGQEVKFPVAPAQIGGAGSPAKYGEVEDAKWIAWTHSSDTRFAMVCWAKDYQVEPIETAHLKAPISTAKALWQRNVWTDCSTDPFFRPAYRSARAAFNLP